jgi:anthranilate phosphoribosyltransferase
LDEISTVGNTLIAHLKEGSVVETQWQPSDFGVKKAKISDLQTFTAEENAEVISRILCGKALPDAKTDIVLVNSAAGIIVGGKACDFKEGFEIARESIGSGAAYSKLKALVKLSGGNLQKLEEIEHKHD